MKVGENMCQMTLNSHAKFHGDRNIGGAITVKEAFKNTIFQLYINVNCKKTFIFSHIHMILHHMIEHRILNNFVSGSTSINQSVI